MYSGGHLCPKKEIEEEYEDTDNEEDNYDSNRSVLTSTFFETMRRVFLT